MGNCSGKSERRKSERHANKLAKKISNKALFLGERHANERAEKISKKALFLDEVDKAKDKYEKAMRKQQKKEQKEREKEEKKQKKKEKKEKKKEEKRNKEKKKGKYDSDSESSWSDSPADDDEEDVDVITWDDLPPDAALPAYWRQNNPRIHFDEKYVGSQQLVDAMQLMFDSTFLRKTTRDRRDAPPTGLKVVQVLRIEDLKMWTEYLWMKESLRQRRGGQCTPIMQMPGQGIQRPVRTYRVSNAEPFQKDLEQSLNEFYLFHGSSVDAVSSIMEDNFLLSLAGKATGTMFGNGVYFAECSSKADEYAKSGSGMQQGIYAMIVARVCLGEMLVATKPDVPTIERELCSGRYDAVLGDNELNRGTYREFVVYRERQIYPEYAVLYKRLGVDYP